nr:VOC family protein [Williamsia sterculiae]
MTLRWEQVVVDALDPVALGTWWAEVLGWTIVNDSPGEFEIQSEPGVLPGIIFEPVTAPKTEKNRVHLDFRPTDQTAAADLLEAHGARRVDIGQGDQQWIVYADPEGNEFCLLHH